MSGHLWLATAYLSFAILVAVTVYRIAVIVRMPFHLRWELAPLPGTIMEIPAGENIKKTPRNRIARGAMIMLKEVFLLKTVWKNNRRLWAVSYCMHLGLYICVMVWIIITMSLLLPALLDNKISWYMLHGAGFIGYAASTIGALGIVLLRIVDEPLRRYSSTATFFNLVIVLLFSASGLVMWIAEINPVDVISVFIENCLKANPDMPLYGTAAVHVASMLLFAAVLPFTQMIHYAAKFFTFHHVLWDDRETGPLHQAKLESVLSMPIKWSAPHVDGVTGSSWRDAVIGVHKDEK